MIAVEDSVNNEEDKDTDKVQPENTFMVDLSEIVLRIHGEVHEEEE